MCLQRSSKIMKVQATFLFETFLVRKDIVTQQQDYNGKGIKCHLNLQLQEKNVVSKIAKQKYACL